MIVDCFAFAEFNSAEAASKASEALNGKKIPDMDKTLYAAVVKSDYKKGQGKGGGKKHFRKAPDGGAAFGH